MGPLEIPKKYHELIDLQAKANSSQSPEHSPKTDHYELFCVYIPDQRDTVDHREGRYHKRVCDPMTAKAHVAEQLIVIVAQS